MKREQIERLKETYPTGSPIELSEMAGEPQMKKGLKGTVTKVDDAGQIHVRWENGSSLALNAEQDDFCIGRSSKETETDRLLQEYRRDADGMQEPGSIWATGMGGIQ